MRLRFLAVAGAVIACASLYLLMPRPSAPAEFATEAATETSAASIDFDALHAQAAAALESLEQSRMRRIASAKAL
jgi:hypothetical protein